MIGGCGKVAPQLVSEALGVAARGRIDDSRPAIDRLKKVDGITVAPMITQFGWQFEKQFYNGGNGVAGLTEAVVLFGDTPLLRTETLSRLLGQRRSASAQLIAEWMPNRRAS